MIFKKIVLKYSESITCFCLGSFSKETLPMDTIGLFFEFSLTVVTDYVVLLFTGSQLLLVFSHYIHHGTRNRKKEWKRS